MHLGHNVICLSVSPSLALPSFPLVRHPMSLVHTENIFSVSSNRNVYTNGMTCQINGIIFPIYIYLLTIFCLVGWGFLEVAEV